MADFLGGLLSGGGGLYDDLLTPQQQSQLSSRGLLSLAGAFADAAMPSRFPVPLGAAIGKAAAAMSGGRDEAALKLLQGQKLSQEVQTMKMTADLQKQFMDDLRKLPLDALIQRVHGGGGGAPAAGPSVLPGATSAAPAAAPTTLPLPPAAAALPDIGAAAAASAAGEYGGGQAPTGLLGSAPPLPPGDVPPAEPPLKASSLGAPDTVLPNSPGGLLTRALYGGGAGTPPFGPGGEPTVRLAAERSPVLPGTDLSFIGPPGPGAPGWPAGNSSRGGAPDAGRQARVDFWQSQGAPAHVAQGIADRVRAESSFDPSAMGDSNTSGGFYQHHADRLTRLQNFAASQNKPWTDPGVQDQFAASEVKGGDAIAARHWPEILAAPTREAAATLWDKYFERSKYGPGAGGRAPDEVIRPGGGVPGFTRAQYSGGGAAPGASGAPAVPVPPGVDPQGMNTLLLELAKRNAMAEILKLGNPYSSMLSVLQGSPEYKAQIETATRGAGLPFIRKEAEEKAIGGYGVDIATRTYQAGLDAANKEKEQIGAAARDLTIVNLPDGNGNLIERQVTRAQAIDIAHGLPVPELGFKGMYGPGVGKPVLTPGQQASDTEMAQTSVKDYRAANDAARMANGRIQQYGQMAQAAQGFTSGPNAERWYVLKSQLKDLGWIKGTDVPDMEVFQNAARKMQVIAAPKGQGGVSNYERELFASTVPQIVTSPEGLAKAIDIARRLDEYDVKVAGIHRDVAQSNRGRPDSLAADARIAALGPPITPEEMQALDALRSQGGAAPPNKAAPAATAPTTPGTFTTPYGTVTRVPN